MENQERTLKADGFDSAIIGIYVESEPPRLIYSKQRMIEVLLSEEMELDEAIEFLEYNTWAAYAGPGTPMYIDEGNYEQSLEILESIGG